MFLCQLGENVQNRKKTTQVPLCLVDNNNKKLVGKEDSKRSLNLTVNSNPSPLKKKKEKMPLAMNFYIMIVFLFQFFL